MIVESNNTCSLSIVRSATFGSINDAEIDLEVLLDVLFLKLDTVLVPACNEEGAVLFDILDFSEGSKTFSSLK